MVESEQWASAPPSALLRSTYNRELMASWSLVLEAIGIPAQVIAEGPLEHLVVAPADHDRAVAALNASDREARAEPDREPAAPDGGRSFVGLAFVVTIAAFHFVSGARADADLAGWFRRGSSVAEKVVAGEWWRGVTALTLHADWGHVFGNSVAAMVFLSALGRWMGGGLAVLATVVAGTLGNLLVAYAYGVNHNSVGASTATFAALGILGGLQAVRWMGRAPGLGRRRRILSAVAACLGVFAMVGVGEKVDVLAHLAGLGVGLPVGFLIARTLRLPSRPAINIPSGLLTAGVVAMAWVLAFR